MQVSRDEHERRKARGEGERAPSPDEASAGHGGIERTRLRFLARIISSANAFRPRVDESEGGGACRQGRFHWHIVLEIRQLVRSALHAGALRVSRQSPKTLFERDCLTDYAEVFRTVCVDAAIIPFRVASTFRDSPIRCRPISGSASKSPTTSRRESFRTSTASDCARASQARIF